YSLLEHIAVKLGSLAEERLKLRAAELRDPVGTDRPFPAGSTLQRADIGRDQFAEPGFGSWRPMGHLNAMPIAFGFEQQHGSIGHAGHQGSHRGIDDGLVRAARAVLSNSARNQLKGVSKRRRRRGVCSIHSRTTCDRAAALAVTGIATGLPG